MTAPPIHPPLLDPPLLETLATASSSLVGTSGDPTHWVFVTAGAVYSIALLASLWRLVLGPTLCDRVVALDLIGFLAVGMILVYAIATERSSLVAVALCAALILFLGTAAFAVYVERKAGTDA